MNVILALVVGALYAAGLYLMMRRSLIELIIGLSVLSHAANLLIFSAGGLVRAGAPIIDEGAAAITDPVADPLPQALILTAIVISFAVTAFAVVLIYRAYQTVGTDDLEALRSTDTACAEASETGDVEPAVQIGLRDVTLVPDTIDSGEEPNHA